MKRSVDDNRQLELEFRPTAIYRLRKPKPWAVVISLSTCTLQAVVTPLGPVQCREDDEG